MEKIAPLIKVLKDLLFLIDMSQIIIKIKNGEEPNKKEYLNLPNNIHYEWGIFKELKNSNYGTQHQFFKG